MDENVEVRPIRRRHSAEFKAEAVRACLQPGVSIAAIALHYRLNANLLRRWVADYEAPKDAPAPQPHQPMMVPMPEFVSLQLPSPTSTAHAQEIVIDVKRGTTTVTVRWPRSAAAECATWLQEWLR
jgi:transposase